MWYDNAWFSESDYKLQTRRAKLDGYAFQQLLRLGLKQRKRQEKRRITEKPESVTEKEHADGLSNCASQSYKRRYHYQLSEKQEEELIINLINNAWNYETQGEHPTWFCPVFKNRPKAQPAA